jgi:hypothetical protein
MQPAVKLFSRSSKPAFFPVAIALVFGVVLGSLQYLTRYLNVPDMPISGADVNDGAAAESASVSLRDASNGTLATTNQQSVRGNTTGNDTTTDSRIFAARGLQFEPASRNGQFIGYRVIENQIDSRFSVGDIIVSIGQSPLDASAAGGELFIATLLNPDAEVQILDE